MRPILDALFSGFRWYGPPPCGSVALYRNIRPSTDRRVTTSSAVDYHVIRTEDYRPRSRSAAA
jgi:hypothetical protein